MPIHSHDVPSILGEMARVSCGTPKSMEEILQGIPPEAVELYELTVRKLTNMVRRLESPRQGHLMVNCHPDEGEGALYSVGPGRKRTPKPEPVTPKLYPTRFEREDVI